MAPAKAVAPFAKDERVLCFHHEMLYEAKVLDSRATDGGSWQYKIHYKGWKNTWDDWVPQDRVRKFTEENKQLAAQLHEQMKALQGKPAPSASKSAKTKGRANGSDFSSARGRGERAAWLLKVEDAPRGALEITISNSKKRSNPFAEGVEKALPPNDPVAKRLAALTLPIQKVPEVPAHIANYVPKNPALIAFLLDTTQHPTDFLSKLPPTPDYQYLTKSGRVKQSITLPHPPTKSDLKKKKNPIIPNEPARTHPTDSDGSSSDKEPEDPKERISRMRKAIKRIHNGSIGFQEDRPCHRATFTRCFATRHLDYFLTRFNVQEDGFLDRPAISLPIPDRIKAILVDDWENVTKNQQLVPLPAAHPVESILKDYEDDEMPKRAPGSPEASFRDELLAGLREYFDKCLGRILLYRFERAQYLEMIQLWEAPTGDMAGKNANQTYGAEHLCRLLVSLPELIAQTNMDQQSVSHLREEIIKLTNWMVKKPNLEKYFVAEYETPNQSYIDMAR
ncbi:hypothetical protein VE04_09668, partial [Pseudogymnoascus sp. 24MN13]